MVSFQAKGLWLRSLKTSSLKLLSQFSPNITLALVEGGRMNPMFFFNNSRKKRLIANKLYVPSIWSILDSENSDLRYQVTKLWRHMSGHMSGLLEPYVEEAHFFPAETVHSAILIDCLLRHVMSKLEDVTQWMPICSQFRGFQSNTSDLLSLCNCTLEPAKGWKRRRMTHAFT